MGLRKKNIFSTSFPSGPVTTVQFLLQANWFVRKSALSQFQMTIMFLPLEFQEVFLLSVKIVDAANAIVVTIKGGKNSRATKRGI